MLIKIILNKFKILVLHVKAEVFIYMRLVTCIILFLGLLFLCNYGYVIAPLATIIYYFGIEYFILDLGIIKRIKLLEKDAVGFFPVFLINLKYTKNVKNALDGCCFIADNALTKEFKYALGEVKIGKSLEEALNKMIEKIPSKYVNDIIRTIIVINRTGNDLSGNIKSQLDNIIEKNTREKFNCLKFVSIKMAFVSIIFVFLILIMFINLVKYL